MNIAKILTNKIAMKTIQLAYVHALLGLLPIAATPYLAPDLPEADLASPVATYQSELSATEYTNLLNLIGQPSLDTDGDGFTDLQEFLTGANANDSANDPEAFNLALAMAVDWPQNDVSSDLLARLEQTTGDSNVTLPTYLNYLSPTLETQFRLELAQLADKLNYNPVEIYEWVYTNIEYEDYELSRKGALTTYRTGRGNEYDQCSLLIALYRMSGIPARYVVGPQYESVPTLPDEISKKDIVFVQAWLPAVGDHAILSNPLDSANHFWYTLVPWYKTTDVIDTGIDFFHTWVDSNNDDEVSQGDQLTVSSIPNALEVTRDYFLATESLAADAHPDAFDAHEQQTSVEFFEQQLQAYLSENYDNKSIKDIPLLQQIVIKPTGLLPRVLPSALAEQLKTVSENVLVAADLSEVSSVEQNRRAYAELEIWKSPLGINPEFSPLIAYWTADDATSATESITRDGNGNVWNATPVNDLRIKNGRKGYAFSFNQDLDDDGNPDTNDAYLKIAETVGSGFGHQGFSSRTIAMWLNVDKGGTAGTHILYEEGNATNGITVRIHQGKIETLVVVDGRKFHQQGGQPFSLNYGADFEQEWHHLVVIVAGHGYVDPISNEAIEGKSVIRYFFDGRTDFANIFADASISVTQECNANGCQQVIIDSQYTMPAHSDGGAIGARIGEDAFGNTGNGDYFRGMIDEVVIYDGILSKSLISILFGSKIIDYDKSDPIRLAQIADRRLTVDFDDEENLQHKLDGILLQEPSVDASFQGLNVQYEVFYSPDSTDEWVLRPRIRKNSLLNISLDALSASAAGIQSYAKQLQDRSPVDAVSNDHATRESYLGRSAALMAETFNFRLTETQRRTEELMGLKRLHREDRRNIVLIWTYPGEANGITSAQLVDESAIGIAAGWRIDANFWYVPTYSARYPLLDYGFDHELSNYATLLAFSAGSYNEALVFEDWQGTPGLSTIAGFFAALRAPGNNVVVFDNENQAGSISSTLNLSEARENYFAEQVKEGATVWTTINEPTIYYPDGHPQAGNVAVQSDVALISTNYSASWLYGRYNGGQSDEEIDEEARIDLEENLINITDFGVTNPILVDYAKDAVDGDFIQACLDEQVARSVFVGGDPVDLVTGEFFLQEPVDITISSRGYDLEISRKYKSQAIYNGPLGYGWTWNHGESLVFITKDNKDFIIYYDNERVPSCVEDTGGNTFIAPAGLTFDFTRETDGEYLITYKTGKSLRFASDGLLLEKRDRFNNKLEYTYDAQGRMTAITDALERSLVLSYDDTTNPNKITSITDFTSRSVSYAYDAEGNLTQFTDLAGNAFTYAYLRDQDNPLNNHNLSKQILPSGDYLDIHYYHNDTVSHHTSYDAHSSDRRTFHFQYSWLNRYTETWTENGHYQKIFYNSRWDVTRIQTQDKTLELREYDQAHNMTALVDGNGNRTEYRYDENRNMTSSVNLMDPSDSTDDIIWVYEYEPTFSQRTLEINPLGIVSEFEYDANGNMLAAKAAVKRVSLSVDANNAPVYNVNAPIETYTYPQRGDIHYTYDSYGNRIQRVQYLAEPNPVLGEAYRIQTDYIYDVNSLHLSRIIDPRGNETQYFYDDLGRQVATTDALGYTSQVEYNVYDAPIKEIAADGGVTLSTYDTNRRVIETINAIGAVSQTVYGTPFYVDHVDRVLEEIDPLGYVTAHAYDDAGNRVQTTDRNGNVTRFYYDEENRLIKTVDAHGNAVEQRYDGNGNVIAQTDARGNSTHKFYDRANRLVQTIQQWGEQGKQRSVQYEYDPMSRKTIESIGYVQNDNFFELYRREFIYDARNHLIKTIDNVAEPQAEQRYVENAYDSLGRLTQKNESGLRRTKLFYDASGNTKNTQIEFYQDGQWEIQQQLKNQYDARNQVSVAYDANGHPTNFVYDAAGRSVEESTDVTDPDSNTVTHTSLSYYNPLGQLVRSESKVGDELVGFSDTTYNLRNEKVTVTDRLGYVTQFSYDPNGNLIETVEHVEHPTYTYSGRLISNNPVLYSSYTYYDGLNRAIATENALGQVNTIEYDENGNPVATVTALGHRSTLKYNENNELIESKDPLGNTIQFSYDERGRSIATIDARGYETSTTYTQFGEVESTSITVTFADNTQQAVVTSHSYDALGNLFTTTDPKGRKTRYEYDALDRVVRLTQGADTVDQVITESEYDANGNLIKQIQAEGTAEQVITQNAYDEKNRQVEAIVGVGEPGQLVTKTHYYDAQLKVVNVDPYGMTTTAQYDILGRLIEQTDQAGEITQFAYDSRGLLTKQTPPTGSPDAVTQYTYDALGRQLTMRQYRDIHYTSYDDDGRVASTTDFNGNITKNVYDEANRLIRATRAVGTDEEASEDMGYDENGNLTHVVDANHTNSDPGYQSGEVAIVSYAYDALNRPYEQIDADGITQQRTQYDATGQRDIVTLRDDIEVDRDYDNLDRLKAVWVRAIDSDNPQQSFTYDALSRMETATDNNQGYVQHTCRYVYDFANRVVSETTETRDSGDGTLINTHTVATEYGIDDTDEAVSQKITKRYPYGDYTFDRYLDRRGSLKRIAYLPVSSHSGYHVVECDYDQMGRPKSTTWRNAHNAITMLGTLTYDVRGREYRRNNGTLYTQVTTYDANSNVRNESVSGSMAFNHTGNYVYQHDPLDRVIEQNRPGSLLDLNWEYDSVGNWVETNQNNPGGTPEARVVNDDNEYISIAGDIGRLDYDDKGNLIEDGTIEYRYDWSNRLAEVNDISDSSNPVNIASYSYDASNRRITKMAHGVETLYVYDNAQVIQELEESEIESSALKRSFIYGGYTDAPLALFDEASQATYSYVRDRRANVIGLINEIGTMTEAYDYTAFGTWNVYNSSGDIVSESAVGNPYGFTGRRWDGESDLWYYRNRQYDPELGRFMQRDPAGFVDGYHLYAYVMNNPMKYVDPMGLNRLLYDSLSPGGAAARWDESSLNAARNSQALDTATDLLKDEAVGAITTYFPITKGYFMTDAFISGLQGEAPDKFLKLNHVNKITRNPFSWLNKSTTAIAQLGGYSTHLVSTGGYNVLSDLDHTYQAWTMPLPQTPVNRSISTSLSSISSQGFGSSDPYSYSSSGTWNWGNPLLSSNSYSSYDSKRSSYSSSSHSSSSLSSSSLSSSPTSNYLTSSSNYSFSSSYSLLGQLDRQISDLESSMSRSRSDSDREYRNAMERYWNRVQRETDKLNYMINDYNKTNEDWNNAASLGFLSDFQMFMGPIYTSDNVDMANQRFWIMMETANKPSRRDSPLLDYYYRQERKELRERKEKLKKELGGGQSAAFIDRSRLIHRNSRAVSGRSTFTGRGNAPRATSLSGKLFR